MVERAGRRVSARCEKAGGKACCWRRRATEQHPEDWWHATLDVIAAIRAAQPVAFSGLRGIALSGQMHGATLLDKQPHVLRATILWNDTRAFAECLAQPFLGAVVRKCLRLERAAARPWRGWRYPGCLAR